MPKLVNTTNINQAVESSYYTHENFPRFPFLIFFLFKTDFLFVKWSVKKGLTSIIKKKNIFRPDLPYGT